MTTTTPARQGEAHTVATALCRLRTMAEENGTAGDWAQVHTLVGELEARVNHGDRRTVRAQQMRDEIARIVRAVFPGRDEGMVLVANFQNPRLPFRWMRFMRRWPLIGERVQVSTVWSPDNSADCLWARNWTKGATFAPDQLRRLDRLVRTLERQGVFDLHLYRLGVIEGFTWMPEEPEAYPGLERLVLTINPPRLVDGENPMRPTPSRPLVALHRIADAYQRSRTEEDFFEELDFEYYYLLGWSLPRSEPFAEPPAPPQRPVSTAPPAWTLGEEPPF